MAPNRLSTGSEAEREWYIAATKSEEAERVKFKLEAELLREQVSEAQYEHKKRDSFAAARRVYDFVGEITEFSIKETVDDLNDWALQSDKPITLRLCSPGGTVFDGLMLFDFVQDLRRSGIQVITYALGWAASMGAVLFQAGDVRRISRNCWYMVHEPSSIALGKASQMKDEAALLVKLHKQLVGILADRSNLTEKQILARCQRKDWWMPASEVIEHGFADEIV